MLAAPMDAEQAFAQQAYATTGKLKLPGSRLTDSGNTSEEKFMPCTAGNKTHSV
jgi:hypothetical protein